MNIVRTFGLKAYKQDPLWAIWRLRIIDSHPVIPVTLGQTGFSCPHRAPKPAGKRTSREKSWQKSGAREAKQHGVCRVPLKAVLGRPLKSDPLAGAYLLKGRREGLASFTGCMNMCVYIYIHIWIVQGTPNRVRL